MTIPRIEKSQNDKVTLLTLPTIKIWFSYTTPVAFQRPGDEYLTMSENPGVAPTGRHMNTILRGEPPTPDEWRRIPVEEFKRRLIAAYDNRGERTMNENITQEPKTVRDFFTVEEVADIFGCKPGTVYELVKTGSLRTTRVGSLIRIHQSNIDEFVGQGGGAALTKPKTR